MAQLTETHGKGVLDATKASGPHGTEVFIIAFLILLRWHLSNNQSVGKKI
jgi:hypothetical protein